MHADRLSSTAAGIVLQRGDHVGAAEADGRQQAEEQAHDQAQSGRDRRTGEVEIDLLRDREAQIPSRDRGNAEQHERAQRAGAKRQQDRFEEQMLDQSPPIRAERHADRELALASRAADQHHAGNIQAHDRQHRSHQAEQDGAHTPALRTPRRPHRAVGLHRGRLEFVRRRIALGQAGYGGRDQRVGLLDVDARVEAAVHAYPIGRAIVAQIGVLAQPRVPLQGQEDRRARRVEAMEVTAEVVGCDPDHRMRDPVDRHGLADDAGVRRQPAPPEVVAQDDARLGRGFVVDRGIESLTARQRHAERAEVVGRDEQGRHARRRLVVRGRHAELARVPAPAGDGHADVGIAQRLVIRIGPRFDRPLSGFGAERTKRKDEELDQPRGVDDARRSREHSNERQQADHSADADTERDDADQREAPVLEEGP